MRVVGALVTAALVLGTAAPAAAAEGDAREPPVAAAIGTGVAVALAPLIAGSALFASSNDDSLRRTATYVAMSGLVLAPAASHLLTREYKRAAIFAALPLAGLVTDIILFQIDPQVTTLGSAESRTTFGIALTVGVLGAAAGLIDTFGASDRWRARHRVQLAPALTRTGGGLTLGATF